MAFPNISDIAATTIEARSKKIQDNVRKNNAVFMRLSEKGKVRPLSGGRIIYEELSFAENSNGAWYSGYDTLPVGASDVISAAEFAWKQLAVPVTISGLEEIQNSGQEAVIDLLDGRIGVAEATIQNMLSVGIYSDGTTFGGKSLTGFDAAVPQDPTTGTYGGINRATAANVFWRSQLHDPASTPTASTIQAAMNILWAACTRGNDRPDLILAGGTIFNTFLASLQAVQQITNPKMAEAGFTSVKYMGADVVLDGGIGGAATATDMYFINTNYLSLRPHKDRNMVPIGKKRAAVNQDASVEIIGWAGNLTCSGAQFQGRLKGD
ncbi:MAG: phage major capsid protein [Planctomycetes bacterium]|nr:phage major capsid protein [Planctomycetota bacterium]